MFVLTNIGTGSIILFYRTWTTKLVMMSIFEILRFKGALGISVKSDLGSFPDLSRSTSVQCFSCTTLNANRLLNDVQDVNWRRWLENVQYVLRTKKCSDTFDRRSAFENGVKSQECVDGVCLKMWFREKYGGEQVWRACIPNSKNSIRSDCTKISSSQGVMEVCTCENNLCNSAISKITQSTFNFSLIFVLLIIFILLN